MVLRILIALFLIPAQASIPTYIQKKAQSFVKGEIPTRLMDALFNKRLLLIGESHGTNEAPAFTLDVIRALAKQGPVSVGLEFPKDLDPVVRKFIQTGDRAVLYAHPFFKDRELHSGRASQAVIEMLRQFKSIPNLKVFCFDLPTKFKLKPKMARDTVMAGIILQEVKEFQKPMYVILAGNIHSRLAPGYPGNDKYPTMGSELLRLSHGKVGMGNTTNIIVRSYEGTAWQCWSQPPTAGNPARPDCGLKILKPFNSLYAASVKHSNYFLFESELTDGHRMTVFYRKVTASMPEF